MEFLGMQVEGEGNESYRTKRVEQYSQEHFKASVAAVLRHPEVTGIAWTQYTPYFNDGEPCVFRAGDPYFAFSGVQELEDKYFDYYWMEDDFEETGRVWCGQYANSGLFDKIVGADDKEWGEWKPGQNYRDRDWTWKEGSGPDNAPNPRLFNDIHEFIRLLDGGHYDHAVEDLFGDHAIVRIDKLANKVVIDGYEHD